MNYNSIIEAVAKEVDLPGRVVDKVYKAYWKYIKDTIQALPLKEINSDEDFLLLNTNFNIPSLGKLSCTLQDWKRQKKRYAYIKEFKNNVLKNKESKTSL